LLAQAVRNNDWEALQDLSDRDLALLRVARKLSGEPTKMVQHDWQPLRELGFSDEALLEVAHVVGVFNHLTRLADGMGLELDSPTAESMKSGKLLGA